MKIGIINVTGYAGSELARLLFHHPEAQVVSVTGRSAAGQKLSDVFPHLADVDMTITPDLSASVDVVFSALPHKASAEQLLPVIKSGIKVVDISADFRLKDVATYEQWYEVKHPDPALLEEAVYGLTEVHRKEIRSARLIANPGCYPTASILGMYPALREGLVEPDLIFDCKSGVSGAGRTLSLGTHFSEVNENVFAYSVKGHRHMPEITQELDLVSRDGRTKVLFLTHLIPMTRGILVTAYARLKPGAVSTAGAQKQVTEAFRAAYRDEPFVRVSPQPPQTKHTQGNNLCIVHPVVDARTDRLMVISVLDNLVKGAAGQAIQNMNVMYGLPEDLGLKDIALYP